MLSKKTTKKTIKTVRSSLQKTIQKQKNVSESKNFSASKLTRQLFRINSQSLDFTKVICNLKLSSKDLPSSASLFKIRDLELLKVTFVNASAKNIVIPDIQVNLLKLQKYNLPNINHMILGNSTFKVKDYNEITNNKVQTFVKKLHQVVINGIQVVDIDETLTDTLVDDLLRITELNKFPLMIRNHPLKKIYIEGKAIVSADPKFVITKTNEKLDNIIEELSILVVENKHMKNVSSITKFEELQIAIEIIAAGSTNLHLLGKVKPTDQTIWAMRVISSYVTFYKAVITSAYWKELENGLPKNQSVKIQRWPARNSRMTGFNLAEPAGRQEVFEALAKIRESLLVENSDIIKLDEVIASDSNLTLV